jgi:hypothetical protein
MSSKLVKKLLQQTTVPPTNNNFDSSHQTLSQKRKIEPVKVQTKVTSKEDTIHEQAQALLRLDSAVKKYSSNTANKTFQRHTNNLKQHQRVQNALKRNVGGISNTRSSSSSFAQKPHERSFDKERDKRRKEEGYFEDLARALKKAKESKK